MIEHMIGPRFLGSNIHSAAVLQWLRSGTLVSSPGTLASSPGTLASSPDTLASSPDTAFHTPSSLPSSGMSVGVGELMERVPKGAGANPNTEQGREVSVIGCKAPVR